VGLLELSTSAAKRCARLWGHSDYTRVVGVGNVNSDLIWGYVDLFDSDVAMVPANVFGSGHIMHELGHTLGLCDEGYGTSPVSTRICPSGLAWSVLGIPLTCLTVSSSRCCPNPAGDGPGGASLMCAKDACNRGCSPSSSFGPESTKWLAKELSQYCS
jgi:hypothetical protein